MNEVEEVKEVEEAEEVKEKRVTVTCATGGSILFRAAGAWKAKQRAEEVMT